MVLIVSNRGNSVIVIEAKPLTPKIEAIFDNDAKGFRGDKKNSY